MGLQNFDERIPYTAVVHVLPASGTAKVALPNGVYPATRWDAIIVTTDDTIPHTVQLWFNVSGSYAALGNVAVPAGAGYVGVPAVDLIPLLAPAATACFVLITGIGLAVSLDVALQAGKLLDLVLIGGNL